MEMFSSNLSFISWVTTYKFNDIFENNHLWHGIFAALAVRGIWKQTLKLQELQQKELYEDKMKEWVKPVQT